MLLPEELFPQEIRSKSKQRMRMPHSHGRKKSGIESKNDQYLTAALRVLK